ncbi:uncharacterized protein [Nerophis lumbriciformis]|uniref:uncharacterized protein n=1 Tax=Nerophis lumbriciformis TaxID=546530 RepID=UPI003BABCBED
MRTSVSVTTTPAADKGVSWGRDLYTFVSSAAGHMMRTLQKPRKSRASKRRVNHRRFLHNMIQRKFADMEAANHRLASSLYLKEAGTSSHASPERSPGPKSPRDAQEVPGSVTDGEDEGPPTPSCDWSAQMLPEQVQDNMADMTAGEWDDLMAFFGDVDACLDGEEERCQGDDGRLTSTVEDQHSAPPLPSCPHQQVSFGGVAQSFLAPPSHGELRYLATPPPEDQLPFDDILEDRKSVDFL